MGKDSSTEANTTKTKRQTVKYQHANPLFDVWIKEWEEQARKADSKMRHNFARARKSLRLFPLPVYCGTDCKVLQYFGDKLCTMIDKKIAKYEQEHGPIEWDKHIKANRSKIKRAKSRKRSSVTTNNLPLISRSHQTNPISTSTPVLQDSSPQCYPTVAGSALAAVAAEPVIPAEVITIAEPASAAAKTSKRSKTVPNSRLAKVARRGATNVTAKAASAVNLPSSGISTEPPTGLTTDDSSSILFTLQSGSYDVLLCVDLAETTSKSSKEGIVKELRQNGVAHDVRKLHVGDFAWVAREKQITKGKSRREIILPYIVERKRMDDLASSIKDGRCREQKHRLLQCGIDTAVYLVETAGQHHAGLPLSTCYQAIANTSVVDGLLVKWTMDYRESAAYLTLVTRVLHNTYQGRAVHATSAPRLPCPCPPGSTLLLEFHSFNNSVVKNRQLTAQEMLAKHLLQLSGLSVQKVAAVVKEVSTLSGLVSLLSSQGGTERLADLKGARSGRCVGQQTAAAITGLYTQQTLY